MSNAGFSRYNHFSEINEPLETQEGVLSPSDRRALVAVNLFGDGVPDNGIVFPDDVTVEGVFEVTGSVNGPLTGATAGVVALFAPLLVEQAINADGAIALTTYNTAITSVATTGQAFTLADSAVEGQVKRIQLVEDGGDATVTFNGTATIVFADIGDVAELIWNGTDWIPIALYNMADGTTAPAYTPA